MLPKCWRRQSGKIYLYKGGTVGASNTGNEPYSEYYAWQIAQILGVNAIEYNIAKWKSRLCSKCEIFTSKDISFVPVGNIVKQGGMQAVIDYYGTLDSKYRDMLEDMFVFDAVIANTDRHFGNFGFLVDAATNTLKAPAPLFDHGNSLFNFASPIEMESKDDFINFEQKQLDDDQEIKKYFENADSSKKEQIIEKLLKKAKSVTGDSRVNALACGSLSTGEAEKILKAVYGSACTGVSKQKNSDENDVFSYGIILSTEDGKITCRLTIEEKINELLSQNREQLALGLFGGRLPE